jgi:hypothetical protein
MHELDELSYNVVRSDVLGMVPRRVCTGDVSNVWCGARVPHASTCT